MSAASPISEVSGYCSDPLYHIGSSQVGEGGAVPLTPCPLGTSEKEIYRDNPAILAHSSFLERTNPNWSHERRRPKSLFKADSGINIYSSLPCSLCERRHLWMHALFPEAISPSQPGHLLRSPEGLGRLCTNQPHHTHLPGTPRPQQVWMGSASKRLPQPSPPSQLERQHRVSMNEIFASFNYRRTKSCNASPQAF